MEKSYEELSRLLPLLKREDIPCYRGSDRYLPSETEPVISPAAKDLAARAQTYSPENPLYVVAIGAITNVASALLLAPEIKENIVVVWLGGHSHEWVNTKEFNMVQDIAAARVVMGCGVPFVQLPCGGVVDHFTLSMVELEHHLGGKNPLCDYLVESVRREIAGYDAGLCASRVIWDVTAVSWLGEDPDRYFKYRTVPAPVPKTDHTWQKTPSPDRPAVAYVTEIHRDALAADLLLVAEQIARDDHAGIGAAIVFHDLVGENVHLLQGVRGGLGGLLDIVADKVRRALLIDAGVHQRGENV
jgi:hypothetical protein